MAITGVDHLVFLVEDIDKGIDTWQNRLGLTLTHRVDVEEIGLRQAFFSLSDGTFIELIAPAHEQSPLTTTLKSRGEGLHTVAVAVDDLDKTTDALHEQGATLVGVGTPQVFVHPKSANGVRIQLWPKDRPHRWRDNPSESST